MVIGERTMLEGWQKEQLRIFRVELVDSIIPDDLLNKLYSKKIITRRQLIDIPVSKVFIYHELSFVYKYTFGRRQKHTCQCVPYIYKFACECIHLLIGLSPFPLAQQESTPAK